VLIVVTLVVLAPQARRRSVDPGRCDRRAGGSSSWRTRASRADWGPVRRPDW